MHTPTVLAASLLAALARAAPTEALWPRADTSPDSRPAVDIIADIMPDAASCNLASFPQCTTAADAAPYLIEAMSTHGIYDSWEIAAVLSLTAMESMQLKYKAPAAKAADKGKGTSNMQSGKYNLEFAKSLPQLAGQVQTITGGSASPTDDQQEQVLKLLQDNKHNFQSGAWFLATQCGPDVREGIRGGTRKGWLAYVEGCVGVTAAGANDPEWAAREKYWTTAMAAFGLSYSA